MRIDRRLLATEQLRRRHHLRPPGPGPWVGADVAEVWGLDFDAVSVACGPL